MSTAAVSDARQHILDVAEPLVLCKGFTAVGLAEVLAAAEVPKGSFYHWFDSKDEFGEAMVESYFATYLARVDGLLASPGTGAERLLAFFADWLDSQTGADAQSRCLAVKLGGEVSDLSERMRMALQSGTESVVARLARCVEAGIADGSLPATPDPRTTAVVLYQSWLGASLLAKIARDRAPLDAAIAGTHQQLGLRPAA